MESSEATPPTIAPEPQSAPESGTRRIPTVYIVTAAVILVVTLIQVSLLFL